MKDLYTYGEIDFKGKILSEARVIRFDTNKLYDVNYGIMAYIHYGINLDTCTGFSFKYNDAMRFVFKGDGFGFADIDRLITNMRMSSHVKDYLFENIEKVLVKVIDDSDENFYKENVITTVEKEVIDKFNGFIHEKIENLMDEYWSSEIFLEKVYQKVVNRDTNTEEIDRIKQTIKNKHIQIESSINNIASVNSLKVFDEFSSKIESAIINVEKRIVKKHKEYTENVGKKKEQLEAELEKVEEKLVKIKEAKELFLNKLRNYKERVNKYFEDRELLLDIAKILADCAGFDFDKKIEGMSKKEMKAFKKNHLLIYSREISRLNERLVKYASMYYLYGYDDDVLAIFEEFFVKGHFFAKNTPLLKILNTEARDIKMVMRKTQLNLIYFLSLAAKEFDEMEKDINETNREAYNNGLIDKKNTIWKDNGMLGFNHTYSAINGFSHIAREKTWENANDIINYKKAYLKIPYGNVAEVLIRCDEIAAKFNAIYDYWHAIFKEEKFLKHKKSVLKEAIKNIDKIKEIYKREFLGDMLVYTVEQFGMQAESFIIT
jgi:hypothetical protein